MMDWNLTGDSLPSQCIQHGDTGIRPGGQLVWCCVVTDSGIEEVDGKLFLDGRSYASHVAALMGLEPLGPAAALIV